MEESIETNSEPASPTAERLSEVLRLTATLSDRVLDAQIMKRPVPDDQVRALAGAARLLREHEVEWPPLLTQVLHELAQTTGEGEEPDAETVEADAPSSRIKGLARLLAGFRKEKVQP